MKKLQNNFTTPEQSKRLLELGVPADSADCYYVTRNSYTAILFNELFTECGDKMIKVSKTAHRVEMQNDDALPCWSVGRLMEIFEICDVTSGEIKNNMCCIPSIKRMSYMEYMMKCFTKAIEIKILDFSKLEE